MNDFIDETLGITDPVDPPDPPEPPRNDEDLCFPVVAENGISIVCL